MYTNFKHAQTWTNCWKNWAQKFKQCLLLISDLYICRKHSWKFQILLNIDITKDWYQISLSVPGSFRTWVIIGLYILLFFVTLSNICCWYQIPFYNFEMNHYHIKSWYSFCWFLQFYDFFRCTLCLFFQGKQTKMKSNAGRIRTNQEVIQVIL